MSISRQSGLLVFSFFLVSCGSTSDGLSSPETELVDQTAVESSDGEDNIISTEESLAEASESGGCSGYTQSSEFAPFATQWGACTFEGSEVQAYEFPNKTALDEFYKTVSGFGVTVEQAAVRSLKDGRVFVWAPDDATKLASLKSAFQD